MPPRFSIFQVTTDGQGFQSKAQLPGMVKHQGRYGRKKTSLRFFRNRKSVDRFLSGIKPKRKIVTYADISRKNRK